MDLTTYSTGSKSELLNKLSNGSIWVKGSAKQTVKRMADAGLVEYSAQSICDNVSSRAHEEYHVWLKK